MEAPSAWASQWGTLHQEVGSMLWGGVWLHHMVPHWWRGMTQFGPSIMSYIRAITQKPPIDSGGTPSNKDGMSSTKRGTSTTSLTSQLVPPLTPWLWPWPNKANGSMPSLCKNKRGYRSSASTRTLFSPSEGLYSTVPRVFHHSAIHWCAVANWLRSFYFSSLCSGQEPAATSYNQGQMRGHFLNVWLSENIITRGLKFSNQEWTNSSVLHLSSHEQRWLSAHLAMSGTIKPVFLFQNKYLVSNLEWKCSSSTK